MQAIETKYFGPSNVKGSRIKATAMAGSVTVEYDHALDSEGNHKSAAMALQFKMVWIPGEGNMYGELKGGTLKGGNMVWVMVPAVKEDTRCAVCGVEAAKHGYW